MVTTHRNRDEAVGVAMYLVAALLFALNGSLAKLVLNTGLSPVHITQVRNAGSFVILFLVVLITRPRALRIGRSELPFLLVYGVVAFAVVQFLYFATISLLPVGVGTLLAFLAPVMVALWVKYGRGEAVSNRIWLAIAMTVAGLALVAQVWNGLQFNVVGVLCGLVLAVTLAIYWILGESGQKTRDPVSLTMWGFFFATLTYLIFSPPWRFPWNELTAPTAPIREGWPAFPVWQTVYMTYSKCTKNTGRSFRTNNINELRVAIGKS